MSEINTFDPVLFSIQENEFLLENLGKPTIVALQGVKSPVNPKAVKPILDRVNELEELNKHEGQPWVGVERLRGAIKTYLRESEKWKRDRQRYRRAPRFPSLYSFDQKGRAHLGGVGSDSGRVRTYFDEKGNRVPFEVKLIEDGLVSWAAPGFTESSPGGLIVNDEKSRIECPVCGHAESYRGESRSSYAAARARMSKHLRGANDRVDEHREVHQEEFA